MEQLRCALSLLLILCLTCSTFSIMAVAAVVYGDVDFNNKIDASDALLCLQSSVKLTELNDEQIPCADVDGNGTVNAADALLILQHSVKLIRSFPVEASAGLRTSPYSEEETLYDTTFFDGEVTIGPNGPRMIQMGVSYQAKYAVPCDTVRYIINAVDYFKEPAAIERAKSWMDEYGVRELGLGIDCKGGYWKYVEEYGGSPGDVQTDASGNIVGFTIDGILYPYMVPTEQYVEFMWEMVDYYCSNLEIAYVTMEEPDFRSESGYSEGFKKEWKAYYGEDWEDPASSPLARYRSARLKVYLFERQFKTIGQRLDEKYPGTKLIIATHSTPSYNHNGLTPGISHYANLPEVDGIIGQTWSNTVSVRIPYAGGEEQRIFESGYLGYGSYIDSMGDSQVLYALTDPYADFGTSDWDFYIDNWRNSMVAQLLHPEIHNFQESIWLDRSFTDDVPEYYRSMQLSVFGALEKLSGQPVTVYGGTAGISFGLSDSLGWQKGLDSMASYNTANGYYGITVPLVERGIPLTQTALDSLDSVEDLKDVKVLILSYEIMKPMSEKVNEIIAEWVKSGGVLLYLGGEDAYSSLPIEWWGEKGQTPFENLLKHLGVQGIQTKPLQTITEVNWCGEDGYGTSFNDAILNFLYGEYATCFEGAKQPILTTDAEETLGFTQEVGLGQIVVAGMPSSYYSSDTYTADLVRDLVEYAVSFSGRTYMESNLMMAQRGDYMVIHTFTEEETLTGHFVDLYDPELTPVKSITVEANGNAFLHDLSSLSTEGTPRLVDAGISLLSEVEETDDQTHFTFFAAASTTVPMRFLGNGRLPQTVTLMQNGQEMVVDAVWDSASQSLLVQMETKSDKEIELTITWGDTLGDYIELG